jgi:membrane protease YdiL (CAAX protease family)
MKRVEPTVMFAAIMAYIWVLRAYWPSFSMVIVAAMLLSHVVRREWPRTLGFRIDNFRKAASELAVPVALLSLALLACGFALHTLRAVPVDQGAANLAAYLPWGVVQQYVLNGYFLRRLERGWSRRSAPLMASVLFAAVHVPNWFLMAVVLAAGGICTYIYRRCPNLWVLGLAHGLIGFLLFLVVPDTLSHHLRVGPGWFAPRRVEWP